MVVGILMLANFVVSSRLRFGGFEIMVGRAVWLSFVHGMCAFNPAFAVIFCVSGKKFLRCFSCVRVRVF